MFSANIGPFGYPAPRAHEGRLCGIGPFRERKVREPRLALTLAQQTRTPSLRRLSSKLPLAMPAHPPKPVIIEIVQPKVIVAKCLTPTRAASLFDE